MKSIAWAVGIGLPVCVGAIGYACGGTNGAVYGVAAGLAVFILARLVVSLRHENVHRADYADGFVSRKLRKAAIAIRMRRKNSPALCLMLSGMLYGTETRTMLPRVKHACGALPG